MRETIQLYEQSDSATDTPSSVTGEGSEDDTASEAVSRRAKLVCVEAKDVSMHDSSGYSSSTENNQSASSSEEVSDSSDPYDASDEDNEDVEGRLWFLGEKQKILSRASALLNSEKTFEASCAHIDSQPSWNRKRSSPLWNEAMDVLHALGKNVDETPLDTYSVSSSTGSGKNAGPWSRKRQIRNHPSGHLKRKKSPRDPSIDVSSVVHSTKFVNEQVNAPTIQYDLMMDMLRTMPSTIFQHGQWMAQALVWSSPLHPKHQIITSDSHSMDRQAWKMVSNPTSLQLRLLPPYGNPIMDRAVDIEEAMAFSSQARVLTHPTPPFSVVFANRAFLGLNVEGRSNGSGATNNEMNLIGRPIESIVQVVFQGPQDISGDTTTATGSGFSMCASQGEYLPGLLPLNRNKACRIQVFPVIDRSSGRRRILQDGDQSDNESYASMSHILVQVTDVEESEESGSIMEGTSMACQEGTKNIGTQKKGHCKEVVVGTIG